MPTVPDEQVFRIRENAIEWLEVDGEVVALDSRRMVYLSTNETGALIWHELSDGGATVAELVRILTSAFDIDEGSAEADVREFLSNLEQQDLLAGNNDG